MEKLVSIMFIANNLLKNTGNNLIFPDTLALSIPSPLKRKGKKKKEEKSL